MHQGLYKVYALLLVNGENNSSINITVRDERSICTHMRRFRYIWEYYTYLYYVYECLCARVYIWLLDTRVSVIRARVFAPVVPNAYTRCLWIMIMPRRAPQEQYPSYAPTFRVGGLANLTQTCVKSTLLRERCIQKTTVCGCVRYLSLRKGRSEWEFSKKKSCRSLISQLARSLSIQVDVERQIFVSRSQIHSGM